LDNFSFQNRGKGLDMNVQGAWAEGITGNGVVVTILDDGLEKDHPDLLKNYVSIWLFFLKFIRLPGFYKKIFFSVYNKRKVNTFVILKNSAFNLRL